MRYGRLCFLLPLAFGLLAALSFFAPHAERDYTVVARMEAVHIVAVADLVLPECVGLAAIDTDNLLKATSPVADAHAVAYDIANQPGSEWRVASDTTFSLIDPHIVA